MRYLPVLLSNPIATLASHYSNSSLLMDFPVFEVDDTTGDYPLAFASDPIATPWSPGLSIGFVSVEEDEEDVYNIPKVCI